jgi:hypothetical protein
MAEIRKGPPRRQQGQQNADEEQERSHVIAMIAATDSCVEYLH